MTRNTIMFGVVLVLCAGSMIWLEGRFSASDQRKAVALVADYSLAHRAESFHQYLSALHGGVAGRWDAEVTHSCRGVARVSWSAGDSSPAHYLWDVDLPSGELFAVRESPEGKRLLQQFQLAEQELPPLELPPLDVGQQVQVP